MKTPTELFDQALRYIAIEIQKRQATLSDLQSKANCIAGEINGLREAQFRVESVRDQIPKTTDPNTGEPVP